MNWKIAGMVLVGVLLIVYALVPPFGLLTAAGDQTPPEFLCRKAGRDGFWIYPNGTLDQPTPVDREYGCAIHIVVGDEESGISKVTVDIWWSNDTQAQEWHYVESVELTRTFGPACADSYGCYWETWEYCPGGQLGPWVPPEDVPNFAYLMFMFVAINGMGLQNVISSYGWLVGSPVGVWYVNDIRIEKDAYEGYYQIDTPEVHVRYEVLQYAGYVRDVHVWVYSEREGSEWNDYIPMEQTEYGVWEGEGTLGDGPGYYSFLGYVTVECYGTEDTRLDKHWLMKYEEGAGGEGTYSMNVIVRTSDGQPIAGAHVVVLDDSGAEVASGDTGPDGRATFSLPGPVEYTVEVAYGGSTLRKIVYLCEDTDVVFTFYAPPPPPKPPPPSGPGSYVQLL
ncbi:MAG: hypothetical protein DRN00_04110, partial [Thermoplasmata archaeon]